MFVGYQLGVFYPQPFFTFILLSEACKRARVKGKKPEETLPGNLLDKDLGEFFAGCHGV